MTGEVNLEWSIPFQFQYTGTSDAESIRANHSIAPSANLEIELSAAGIDIDLSVFPWGNRVWFCITKLDCASMMYDWLVALATVHYAESFQTGLTDEQRRRLLLGANYLLRMALGVAVDYGETVAHETMHNRSLFHCDELDIMGGRNIGCQQDAVAVPWRLYTMARLGLPWVSVAGDGSGTVNVPFTNTIYWDIDLRRDQGDCNGVVTAPTSGATPFQPYSWTQSIECEEANYVFTSASAAATAEDIGNALQIAGVLLGSVTLLAIGTTLEALAELPVSGFAYGDINFNIDRPLEMGGQVTWCCILNRPEECAGDTEPVSCWPLDDPPCGMDFRGCCCADSYVGSA